MLGRGQYAANAALARGASGCPASTQNTGGLKSGSHVSASLNNLPPTMGICHFGCQQQRGDQAYRQRTHGYSSIHESYPSSQNGRFLAAGRRLRQTCLGSNADKGQCAHVGESEVHFARLNKALKQLFFFSDSKCDSSFLEDLPILETARSEPSNGPFFCSHRSFTLLRLGSDGALPHIDSLRTTPKNSSHWAFISLIRHCGCSTAIGDHRCVCLVLK
jgi:hypothetical protein